MAIPLQFTGERFVPGTEGEIAHEHWHRYFFAQRYVAGRRVLDVACGEGYGSALLSQAATDVVGVDIDTATVAHASATYADCSALRFVEGSATALPLPSASVDPIDSYETVEHPDEANQTRMTSESTRVMAPRVVGRVPSPNRPEYSDARNYANPFHLHELDRDELARLLDSAFPARRWFRQRRYFGSALWAEQGGEAFESWSADDDGATRFGAPVAMYFVVIAARDEAHLPPAEPALSLFCDRADREWRRIEEEAREVLRLDALLHERDAALDRQTWHVHHLETLVAERDARLGESEIKLARANEALASEAEQGRSAREAATAFESECKRLERAIAAQERIIAYRQSARWWIRLPWIRVKLLWKRMSGK